MKIRTLAGIVMLTASLPLFAAGGFLVKTALDEKEREVVQKRVTETQCLRYLQAIPNAKVQNAASLTVTVSPVTVPMEALSTASMAEMMCPTRDLAEVCLGDQCSTTPENKGKVSLVMRLDMAKE